LLGKWGNYNLEINMKQDNWDKANDWILFLGLVVVFGVILKGIL